MVVRKILETTIASGGTTATFTDADIPNSLIRVYATNSNIYPQNISLTGNTLTVTYEVVNSAMGVAVEIVKQGLEIVDALNSSDSDKALSAKQGKSLKDSLDTLDATVQALVIPDEITDLSDVEVTSIQDGQVLAWSDDEQKFVNVNQSSASTEIIYSTTPQKIGSWINGNDVMLVVCDLGEDVGITNTSFTTTNIDASDMAALINVKGIYSTGVTSYNLMGNINNGVIRLQADRNDTSISCRYIVITYVKGV